jgi:hypothetical protein
LRIRAPGEKYTVKRISLTLRARDLATSLAGFMAVLVTLVVFDDRVARQLAIMSRHNPQREVVVMRDWLEALGSALALAVRDQSIEHAPMLVFTAVAILLVIFMVRT